MTKAKKSKMGRPKIDNPQDETLPKVRVTRQRLERYRAASEREGKTFSQWVRDLLDRGSD